MELRAAYEALRAAPRDIPIIIETDSEYVINVFTKWLDGWRARGWRTSSRKPVANQSAIQMLEPLLMNRRVTWWHVYGHAGHDLNEVADRRAREAAEAVRDGREIRVGNPGCLPAFTERVSGER